MCLLLCPMANIEHCRHCKFRTSFFMSQFFFLVSSIWGKNHSNYFICIVWWIRSYVFRINLNKFVACLLLLFIKQQIFLMFQTKLYLFSTYNGKAGFFSSFDLNHIFESGKSLPSIRSLLWSVSSEQGDHISMHLLNFSTLSSFSADALRL